ncbi:hypothetical protein J7L67_01965 [bacterium]|nr:hypothetical protein [bacterium]
MCNKKVDIVFMAKKKRHHHLLTKLQKKSLTPGEIRELEVLENCPLPPAVVRTQREVSDIFKVKPRTVANWVAAGMPVRPEGYYDLLAIQAWRYQNQIAKMKETKDTKIYWEKRLKKQQLEKEKLLFKKLKGELIPLKEVEESRVQRILTVKRNLFALPRQLASILANMYEPREIEAYLTERIREVCNTFAGVK